MFLRSIVGLTKWVGMDAVISEGVHVRIWRGPSSARQRNAIQMAFRWQADSGIWMTLFLLERTL